MPQIQVPYPADFVEFRRKEILQGIHERIEEQVRRYSGKTALRTPEAAYTYAEMNSSANSIAAEILAATGTELAQVAILLPNTPEMIISILASLKAHKAYVPLDPNFPKDRLRMMVDDAEPVVILTDTEHLSLAEELAGNRVRPINISLVGRKPDAPNPGVPCDPLDRAYILYTSGSTGRPKGIAFLHRNLLHTSMCLINHLFFSPGDRVTWLHSSSFAASVVDIFCPLLTGGTVYPWDVKMRGFTGFADWLEQEEVTTFQWIPSAFRQFLRTVPDDFIFRNIRLIVMASEPLTTREVELFRRHFPRESRLVNQVGTSESYNYRLYAVDHDLPIQGTNVPGGYAVSEDRTILILDEERRSLPTGSIGEIAIRSEYMSAGYWRDEELNRGKFVRLGDDSTPVYLTGDHGKLEADGCLLHLGRKDFQVKIRGYRVELAEVDHILTSAPSLVDAVSRVVKNQGGQDQLVAYVVAENGRHFDLQAVEKHLESMVPDYMRPSHYVVLDRLPTTPTGKTDRNGLPNPFDPAASQTAALGLTAESLVERVTQVFKEVLQVERDSAAANFMDAGGDSILTAVLMQYVYKRFGVHVAVDKFLELPTAAHLASLIGVALDNRTGDLPVAQSPTKPENSIAVSLGGENPGGGSRSAVATGSEVIRHRGTRYTQEGAATEGNLIIISAGRLGREIFTWATQAIDAGARYRIKGFLDNRVDALAGYDYEDRILGNVDDYEIQGDDVFIGAIGDPLDKIKYYAPVIGRGGRFINIIHPLANIGENVRLGSGILLSPFASLTSDISIGNHVAIGAFSNVGHDAVVGNWCQISSHCGINGRAVLGDAVFLGSHACVVPGVTIGEAAFVGAGSVVIRDVPSGIKVAGNPAIPIGRTQAAPG